MTLPQEQPGADNIWVASNNFSIVGKTDHYTLIVPNSKA